jgi:four helix bundle protein
VAFKFENLRVFHYALEVNDQICNLTKKFPKEELFILTSQMKRAADSVVLNIAEGSTMQSPAEFRRFLVISNRSALEIIGCLYLSKNRKYIDDNIFKEFYDKVEKLVVMIQALINSIK